MVAKSLQENSVIPQVDETFDLRSLRQARGLTLDDVAKATKISVKNLETMEKGDYDHLPPPVYTRAYLKSYARLLGANERQIASRYEQYLTVSAQSVVEVTTVASVRRSYFSRKILANSATVLILCVLGVIVYSYFNLQTADVVMESSLPLPSSGQPVADIDGSAGPAKPNINASADTATRKPAILIITARERTWLRIREDKENAYELLMKPGEKIERAALQYDIDIGNAGGVSVQFQENIMQSLGKSGEVVHLRLP